MTDDLVSWLRTQLDADEDGAEMGHSADCPSHLPGLSDDQLYEPADPDRCTCPSGRWLRDIAAKRAILAEHWVADNACGKPDSRYCSCCFGDRYYNAAVNEKTGEGLLVWCETVRLLALPYADRPGYQEAWKP